MSVALQWVALLASGLLVGIGKAGFGTGLGIVAVPLATLALGPVRMLGALLLVLILGDVLSLIHYPKAIDRRNLFMLVPGCVLGVAAGAVSLRWFTGLKGGDRILAAAIGALCVLFVGMQTAAALGRRRAEQKDPPPPYRPASWHGVLVGGVAGFTSTLSNAAGPIIAMFVLPQRLDKRTYVGTTVTYFFIGNLLKLGPFLKMGIIRRDDLRLLLYLAPLVLAGTLLGAWMNRHLSARWFGVAIHAIVFVTGLKLILGAFGL